MIVKERRRSAEPEHPPAEYLRRSAGEDPERRACGCVGRKRSDGGALVDTTERRAKQLVQGTTVGPVNHKRMDQGDDRKMWAGGGVANRCPATIGIPAQDALVGEAQAPHGVRAHGELHSPVRHLEDVCSAGGIEHVWSLQEACEQLAVL